MLRTLLWLLGIHRSDDAPRRLRFRRRFYVWMAVFVVFVGGGTFMWQSTKSWFCKTCHIMKPYYESWKTSTHGQKGVECIECHFPPGFQNALKAKFRAASMLVSYITGTYATQARAEVEDA